MSEFSIWHILPPGEMPTVRQVLECGGGAWMFLRYGIRVFVSIGVDGAPCYRTNEGGETYNESPFAETMGVTNPRPIEAPMPTPAEVGTESRWRVLCAHKAEGDSCTLRTSDGQIEALFDGDDAWVDLASQWGDGMAAIRDSAQVGG